LKLRRIIGSYNLSNEGLSSEVSSEAKLEEQY